MSENLFPILSNFFFLVPAVQAFRYGRITRAIIYALIPFTSGSFHACDEGYSCVFPFVMHKNLDYIFAILIIPLTALYFVHWGDVWQPLERLLIIIFILLIAVIVNVQQDSESLIGLGIILLSAVLVPVIYWIGYAVNAAMQWPRPPLLCCCHKNYNGAHGARYFPKYEWGALLAGVSLTSIGVYLFMVQGTLIYTWSYVLHSMWHIMAAFGQYYIIQIKAPVPMASYRVLDTDISKIKTAIVRTLQNNDSFLKRDIPTILRYDTLPQEV